MARQSKQKLVLLHLDYEELADLLHLPQDLTPVSASVDSLSGAIRMVFEAPTATRLTGRGMHPPSYRWEQIVARTFEER